MTAITSRLKIPVEMYYNDPKKSIQHLIGQNSNLISYEKQSIITNDSCFFVDVKYNTQMVEEIAIVNTGDFKYDERNSRYTYTHNDNVISIIKVPSPLPEKLTVKIFKIQNPKDGIQFMSIIYNSIYTSLLTPLKNDVEITVKEYPKANVKDREKQIEDYKRKIRNIPTLSRIQQMNYTETVDFKSQVVEAHLIPYYILPDYSITGVIYTSSSRDGDPNMVLYYNDIVSVISASNIVSIKQIVADDISKSLFK